MKRFVDWLKAEKTFIGIIVAIALFRGSILNWYRVPSRSMYPTLFVGDYILVNRLAYGVHLPFTTNSMLTTGEIGRGDIIVFDYPLDTSFWGTLYVKRVIGLPGDHIQFSEGNVYVNRELTCIPSCAVPTFPGPALGSNEFEVPADSYFVMGDNRGESSDSRFWGFVPYESVRGRAKYILANFVWEISKSDFSRLFKKLNSAADFVPESTQ